MSAGRFGSVVTAMITPFGEAGELDLDGAAELARWLAGHGSDALVLAGSTGEATVLSDSEKIELWRCVSAQVTVPVIAGVGTAGTSHSADLARAASDSGAAALLVVVPYYSRPSQAGLEAHFRAVASATSLPMLLYDIPSRTGRRLESKTVLSLASSVTNIVGIKDAAGDVAGTARLRASAPPGFEIYCGDDSLTLPMLSIGACGVISVASHWAGEDMGGMVSAFVAGDLTKAQALNSRLIPSFEFESSVDAPNPLPTKAMMRVMGLPAGQCRLPLGPAPPSLDHQARSILAQLRRSMREDKAAWASAASEPGGREQLEARTCATGSASRPGQVGG